MLVGGPGIGKTRTTYELETYARMRGALVAWGRNHEDAGAPPYTPWVQVGNTVGQAVISDVLVAGTCQQRKNPQQRVGDIDDCQTTFQDVVAIYPISALRIDGERPGEVVNPRAAGHHSGELVRQRIVGLLRLKTKTGLRVSYLDLRAGA